MKIDYHNMPLGYSKFNFTLRYIMNIVRTWILFHFRYPWIKYNGFVRIMPHTRFAKRNISMGHNVQFGDYCNIASDVQFGNYILMASNVSFIGRNDHIFNIPQQFIWNNDRKTDNITIVEDDVWIGTNVIILAGVKIGKGAVIAAGALVNKDIPACEVWGGIPAKKIKKRFENDQDMTNHLQFLENNLAINNK